MPPRFQSSIENCFVRFAIVFSIRLDCTIFNFFIQKRNVLEKTSLSTHPFLFCFLGRLWADGRPFFLSKNGCKKGLKRDLRWREREREMSHRRLLNNLVYRNYRISSRSCKRVIENEGTIINEFNDRGVKISRSADLRFPPRGLNYGALRTISRAAFANPSYRTAARFCTLHFISTSRARHDRYLHCQRKVTREITKKRRTGLRPS